MHAFIGPILSLIICIVFSCDLVSADPWIAGVTPRLVGRGTTSEIVIDRWRHEAIDVLFYPYNTVGPDEENPE